MGPDRLELSTHGLKVRCSTDCHTEPTVEQAQLLYVPRLCDRLELLILSQLMGNAQQLLDKGRKHSDLKAQGNQSDKASP